MALVKLTKNELRLQRTRLKQLQKYLPTLQLKKALLQAEVNEVRSEIVELEEEFDGFRLLVSRSASLLSDQAGIRYQELAKVKSIHRKYENIAGVDIPIFEKVEFLPFEYFLFATPPWLDEIIRQLREVVIAKAKLLVAQEKKEALEKELRQVSIRVNLFEKNLIPRSQQNIKKIKVFLGDQELAAVGQAKAAKAKIEERRFRKKNSENAKQEGIAL